MHASFLTAVKKSEQKQGKTLPELMAEWLVKDPIAMLKVISKFLPREAHVRAAHDHTLLRHHALLLVSSLNQL